MLRERKSFFNTLEERKIEFQFQMSLLFIRKIARFSAEIFILIFLVGPEPFKGEYNLIICVHRLSKDNIFGEDFFYSDYKS